MLLLFCAGQNIVRAEESQKEVGEFSGPILGHTTSEQVSIWFLTEPDSEVVVHYFEEHRKDVATAVFTEIKEITSDLRRGKLHPYKVTIPGLEANTTYHYQVTVDGKSSESLAGKFKTALAPGMPAKFRIATSSCVKGNFHKSWDMLRDLNPEFHLMLGDTVYCDHTDPNRQWNRHLAVRSYKEIANTFRNVPHYAIWDDHDFGANNANGTLKGKEDSLATWKQLWCNPEMGLDGTPGAFYKFSWAEVDFFVLDGRYYRSEPDSPDNDSKTMLGDDQFNWLVKGLKQSKAKFKVLVTGSTWVTKDSWKPFPGARRRLLQAIEKNKISGIVYLSGDLHKCVIREHKNLIHPIGYSLLELTSSGIGKSRGTGGLKPFMVIAFDTTLSDPTITATIHGAHMETGERHVGESRTWSLSDLSPK